MGRLLFFGYVELGFEMEDLCMFVPREAGSYVAVHMIYKLGGRAGEDFDIERALEGCEDQRLLELVLASCEELPTYAGKGRTHRLYRESVQAYGSGGSRGLRARVLRFVTEGILLEENPGFQAKVNKLRKKAREEED